MSSTLSFSYLISGVCFILALQGLSSAATSKRGNMFGMFGMGLAILTTFFVPGVSQYGILVVAIALGGVIGTVVAKRIEMTALPQLVAAFHSLVGLAAVCVAACALKAPASFGLLTTGSIPAVSLFEMGLGTVIGALTFSGSLVAFGKLQGLLSGKPLMLPNRHFITGGLAALLVVLLISFMGAPSFSLFMIMNIVAVVFGLLLILPIGGADMPVVVSMLNSYSGWAACGIGFTLNNHLLIITGALVGASGAILSYIMCKGMNRSLVAVILGGFGGNSTSSQGGEENQEDRPVKVSSSEDAAFLLNNAQSVIIVPGYGMAVAQAQHALKEMATILKAQGIQVRYAIHPVAGRMPGHMNVLLAEANVPYEDVLELDEINADFGTADVAFVIGANDITNPAAKTDPSSPIFGMPILEVEKARTVFFVKRSLSSGYAGVDNELFYRDNTYMVLGDAKKVCEGIVKSLQHS